MGDPRIHSVRIVTAAARLVLKALRSACVYPGRGWHVFSGQHGVAMMECGIFSGSRTPGELGLGPD